MPPVGNHRVRAAMNTSSSDVRSGGIERQTRDNPRMIAEAAPRRLPVMMPSGIPMSVAIVSDTTASAAVFADARPMSAPTGRL
jgi:hypothetical protein